jgi:hypothetical protein
MSEPAVYGDWRVADREPLREPCKRCELTEWEVSVWNVKTHYLTHVCRPCAALIVESREGA